MLNDIQSIPDLRPGQTPVPDIDSIRCPDLTGNTGTYKARSQDSYRSEVRNVIRTEIPPPRQYGSGTRVNSPPSAPHLSNGLSEVPYHARTDSKPFTYGAMMTSSPLPARRPSDCSDGAPSPSIHRRNSRETLNVNRAGLESPRLIRRMSGSVGASRSPSPDLGRRERSQTLTTRIMGGNSPASSLARSPYSRSASGLDDVTDSSFTQDSFNGSWLECQQRRLAERREARKAPHEQRMFRELQARIAQPRENEDGYVSDNTLLSSVPSHQATAMRPLRIEMTNEEPRYGGGSVPSSPSITQRSVSAVHTSSLHSNMRRDEIDGNDSREHLGTGKSIETVSDDWQSMGNSFSPPSFPAAPPSTPYAHQGLPPKSPTAARKDFSGLRTPSPGPLVNGHSSLRYGRRSSLGEPSPEVISAHPKFVKDISRFWYKPNISRDEAIGLIRDRCPGTFVVRDSSSFPGAFGLALKVGASWTGSAQRGGEAGSTELVRHFLIEPTSRGVRLKGSDNEPVFGSLSALVYQHSITALSLPCRLVLPDHDPAAATDRMTTTPEDSSDQIQQSAACSVLYVCSPDTESLTGPQAVRRAVQLAMSGMAQPTTVELRVCRRGITLTDAARSLFFRRHYPLATISHCGLDPDDRRWTYTDSEGQTIGSLRLFGFVARKNGASGSSGGSNACHVLAELEPEQPATAICNFISKVMMTAANRANLL